MIPAIIQSIAAILGKIPEVYPLHLALSLLMLTVSVLVIRRNCGYLLWWAIYCLAGGIVGLVPPAVMQADYWRWMWTPLQLAVLAVLVAAVFDAYRFTVPHTLPEEREMMTTFGCLLGGGFVWILFRTWAPENHFQEFSRLREFALLILAVAHSAAWYHFRVRRPVECPAIAQKHGFLLSGWLWTYWIASTSAKNGTLWLLFRWEGGQNVWRVHNALVMVVECGLMVWWVVSLRSPLQSEAASESVHEHPACR